MTASPRKSRDTNALLLNLSDPNYAVRCQTLNQLCPCRNSNREIKVWKEIFYLARIGGRRERDQAVHAIGTLMDKAQSDGRWRELLRHFDKALDAIMADPRARGLLLGQMKRHGHAHRGAAIQNYRKRRRLLDMATEQDLSSWINDQFKLHNDKQVTPFDAGVQRMWRWYRHRLDGQPGRCTKATELLRVARRFFPELQPRD